MTDYNIWRADQGRWVSTIEPIQVCAQDTDHPVRLSYVEARKVLEYWRSYSERSMEIAELRILNSDDTCGDLVGYNIWMAETKPPRWTNTTQFNGIIQNINDPQPYTYDQCHSVALTLLIGGGVVMEIDSNLMPQPLFDPHNSVATKPVEAPEPTKAEACSPPEEGKFDFDVYCGFKPAPPKHRITGLPFGFEIDPYTGLIVQRSK